MHRIIDPWSQYYKIFMLRIGEFYPNVSPDFDMADCPAFWRNRSIEINLMNLRDQGYLKSLKISAIIAIGFDFIVGITTGVLVWRYSDMKKVYKNSEDQLGPLELCRGFGKFKFILFTIILGLGMPLFDTCTGKGNNSDPTI